MKKTTLAASMAMVLTTGTSTTAHSALLAGMELDFSSGIASAYGRVLGGSYFGMDTNGDGIITIGNQHVPEPFERIALAMYDGLIVGSIQAASGSHTGRPGCVNDEHLPEPTCTNNGENPGIDSAWYFFGNTGMHYSASATSIIGDDGSDGTVDLDFSGWGANWFGADIDLSSGAHAGNPDGVPNITCGTDCSVGDNFTLNYSATVPVGDPSGFGGAKYELIMVGSIAAASTVPIPAAVWLFGSGLIGLMGLARRKHA